MDKRYIFFSIIVISLIVILILLLQKKSKEKYKEKYDCSNSIIQVFNVGTATISNDMWYVSEGAYAIPSAPAADNYHCATSISALTSVVPASLLNVKTGDKLVISLDKPSTDYISAKIINPPGKIAETLGGSITITNKDNAVVPYVCASAMAMQIDPKGNIVTNMIISSEGLNEDGNIKNPNSKVGSFFNWLNNAKEAGMNVYLYKL